MRDDPLLLLLISVTLSTITWGIVTARYVWPALRTRSFADAVRPILLLHGFRFVGLGFLVPGVVSPDLPAEFARPAAYGDLLAAVLALLAFLALDRRAARPLVWAFNLWGTFDLIYALYQGLIGVGVEPSQLGAMYFVPTIVVPLLLITHVAVFALLGRAPQRSA